MPEELFECEVCNKAVPESDAETETMPGARGHTVTLAFCPECVE